MNIFYRFLRCAVMMAVMMAWMMPAVAQTPLSPGFYYIANYHDGSNNEPHYNPSTIATNYYMVPASICGGEGVLDEQWALKEGSTYNHDKPLLTTYHTNKDTNQSLDCEPDFNSIWEISTVTVVENNNNVTYYRFKHWLTGKYVVYNTPDQTNRRAFHLESANDPSSFDGMDLFEISFVNNTDVPGVNSYNIRYKNLTTSHRFVNPSKGNRNNYYGLQNGNQGYVSGLMGVYESGTDPGSKWYFEPATVTAQPTITFDNTTNTVTMACATTDATIYYTIDGETQQAYNGTGGTGPFVQDTPAVIRAFASFSGVSSIETTYNLQKVDTPTVSLDSNTNEVTITSTSGASIYYSIGNENTPSVGFNPYNSPFEFPYAQSNQPLKAIAVKEGWINSDMKQQTVMLYCYMPVFSYDNSTQQVTLSCDDAEALMYYTTDGNTPDPGQLGTTQYLGTPFSVTSGGTVKAIAIHTPNYNTSNVAELSITQVATPTIQNNGSNAVIITCATEGATIYYTTDGSTPTTSSTEYTGPLTEGVSGVTIKAIAVKANLIDSEVGIGSIILQCAAPVITKTSATTFTIECSYPTSDVTIYYNTGDGSQADPTDASTPYSSEVIFNESDLPFTVKAIAYATNYSYSDVATLTITQGNVDYSQNYLTFRVLSDGSIMWKAFGSGYEKTIEYSINNGSWNSITSSSGGATFDVNANDVVRFRGNNTTYAGSKSNYSGFEGGTATFNIEGNIHSLLYGDNFANNTALTNSTYQFCSLFKKALVISAENLVLPATMLKDYCYRALFSWCTTLTTPPALPATTLAQGCYWYMFEQCAFSSAPELNAATLVQECYGHMFEGCASLNHVKCMATSISATNCKVDWLKNVSSTGTFVKESNTTWPSGASGIPSGWTQYDDFLLYSPEITCDGEYITITCNTEGASIYYRLNQTGNFLVYSSPIPVNSNTTVEAYSTKGANTSNTVIITFEVYDNPFDESTRSLDTWTYGNIQVTLPFSVNGIDGHSSGYLKGTHTFETTVTLYKVQPTYLWFQHADQSADIYVDNTFVTTHWGGYNAFFVDITDYVHIGTNRIKVILNNTTRNTLAPCAGDFNFNATLGKVKLLTSPVLPSMDYGYDGMHITSSVTDASATINIKTSIPEGASVVCKIDADDENYHFTETKPSTGSEMTFTTTISNPHLWNGIEDPFLYNVTLEIYHNNELYHRYERPYGFRYYDYDPSTGFLLNGEPYLLRGVCTHHDLEGKANALTDEDIANDFAIIQELGCNFLRLAHYPHPKEVYDWCDRLGIIVQTEVPCVNRMQSTLPEDYYNHLTIQYEDMVNQHYNHPCIIFWGLSNETVTDDKEFGKTKINGYTSLIKSLDPERLVGYVMSHSVDNPSGYYNDPDVDWFGCNIYVGWYIDQNSNNPTNRLNTRLTNTLNRLSKPLAFSEYGCGGTQHCHSDNPQSTTTKGNNPRHDIEYQMWLHEGHIAAIKNFPQLLFTSQWQLFDIAVSNRQEGYTICLDGENTSTDDNLRFLNNKGLVERDHKTKKDPFYLYKAWWNQEDKFVHICGKDYTKRIDRAIKCYTNDGNSLSLYVNNILVETVTVTDNIATFTATDFNPSDVIRVNGATTYDVFTFTNDFITDGNWDVAANWNGNAVPASGSDMVIRAECTIPDGVVVQANSITIGENGSLTIADGGQLIHSNEGVVATVKKNIAGYGGNNNGGWNFIASPLAGITPTTSVANLISTTAANYDLYYYDEPAHYWRNYKESDNSVNPNFDLNNGQGYLYANHDDIELQFEGTLQAGINGTFMVDDLSYVDESLKGFNLVGNPFVCNATIDQSFYVINGGHVEANTGSTIIPPCAGVMVKATASGQSVTFTKVAAQQVVQQSQLQLTLAQRETNRGGATSTMMDNAIVSFNEGAELGKFYFGTQNANIYIPKNGKEFAIVNVGRDVASDVSTEMPVNFRANENGQYTISVNPENIEMNYLHLIDHMTGADVDLLQTPSYSFEVKTTDYESRFKLVFVCGDVSDDNETFAFINNGNIIITADVEGATLQVIDVMGRIILSRDAAHHVSTSGMVPGTYVLRLINADHVMTQKVVIR